MNITTTLTGTEISLNGVKGRYAAIRNDSTDIMYAACESGITAGSDGVLSIPAGQSAVLSDVSGLICLMGTGSAMIVTSDDSTNPFKASAQSGGSGADEVARAAITAHAGNADVHVTAAQKSAWDATLPCIGVVEDLFNVKKTCVCAWNSSTLNTPLKAGLTNAGGGLCIINNTSGSTYTSYLVMISGGTDVFTASSNAGVIRGSWLKISDGGNADTVDGKHASDFVASSGVVTDLFGVSESGLYLYGFNTLHTPFSDGLTTGTIGWCYVDWSAGEEWVTYTARPVGTKEIFVNARYGKDDYLGWSLVSDGGNAASVGAYTEAKLAALEARIAALESKS